ncbi:MAG: glycosyltransferase family 9 protein, partial [Paramuribaculum sp.]|nr:glycosyltransferase family 9 protein [Paramuribaculum sp.]
LTLSSMDRSSDTRPRKACIITRFSALGDVAMTIPAVYGICRSNPSTQFVMVTKAAVAPLMMNRPENLAVEGIDLKNDYRGPLAMWRLWRYLSGRYDIASFADLHDVLRTKLLRAAAKLGGTATAAIIKDRRTKKRLIGTSTEHPATLPTTIERYADVFRRLGFAPAEKFTTLFEGQPLADISAITPEKRQGERWIAIAPFAAHPSKIYPRELMSSVVARLAALDNVRLFFFGAGAEERDRIRVWTERHRCSISLAEQRLGFPVELELLRRMDAVVTMDSANMHLAALAGAPVVSLWGATHPCFGFGGWQQPGSRRLGADLECRPCSVFGNKPCRRADMLCFRRIPPADVVAAVVALLPPETTHTSQPFPPQTLR